MKESFLVQLSKPQPDPGGGAAAAYGAALGLALLEKVVRLELRRRRSATELHRPWHQMLAEIQDLTGDFSRLLKSDIEAYKQLALARSSGNEDLLSDAIARAIDCPMEIMLKVRQVLVLAWQGCGVVQTTFGGRLMGCRRIFGSSIARSPSHSVGKSCLNKDRR